MLFPWPWCAIHRTLLVSHDTVLFGGDEEAWTQPLTGSRRLHDGQSLEALGFMSPVRTFEVPQFPIWLVPLECSEFQCLLYFSTKFAVY